MQERETEKQGKNDRGGNTERENERKRTKHVRKIERASPPVDLYRPWKRGLGTVRPLLKKRYEILL